MADPMKPYYDELRAQGLSEEKIKKINLVPSDSGDTKYEDLTPERQVDFLEHFLSAAKGNSTTPDGLEADDSDGSVDTVCNLKAISKAAKPVQGSKTGAFVKISIAKVNKLYEEMKIGDTPPRDLHYFCPWYMIYKYPQQFVGNSSREKIRRHFTKNNLLNNRVWDFFYVHSPYNESEFLLVPTNQLEYLFDELNDKYRLNLAIPEGKQGDLFRFQFPEAHAPPPRFLGRSTKVTDYSSYRSSVPPIRKEKFYKTETTEEVFARLRNADDPNFVHHRKNKKGPKGPDRRKNWGRTTKRVQRYLGLRKMSPLVVDEADVDEYMAAKKQMKTDIRVEVELHMPVPFEPEGNIVFISIDLEWHELNHNAITEVGIATLETKDIASVPPGEHATNWHRLVKARHIRLKDHVGHRNHLYVTGYPDRFNFGESEIYSGQQTCHKITELFDSYPPSQGQIVLVGHDIAGDIKSLKLLGINVYEIPNLREIVDSKDLHCHLVKTDNGTSVRSSLDHFQLPYIYLHNAGNDAVYTLHAVLATVLKKRLISLDFCHGRDDDPGLLGEGWSSDEEDDGGKEPVLFDQDRANVVKKTENRASDRSSGIKQNEPQVKNESSGKDNQEAGTEKKASDGPIDWADIPAEWAKIPW